MKEILSLSSDTFGLFRDLLLETSGLHFEEDRNQPLHLALWQRLQQRGYESYREYYHLLRFHPEGRIEMRELLDLITVGETYFFRNKAQFQVLMRFVLPELIQRKSGWGEKCLRIWSAGCSRGDEPYSIAIALMEMLPTYKDWSISILGTDVNRNGLACANQGIYGEKDIGHLPKEYLEKYFKVRGTTYHIHPDVKELVRFEYHNLVKDPFAQGKMQNMDLVFCRNVTIYFDGRMTRRVIEKIHDVLAPGGYLFLGHTETLWGINDQFETVEFPQAFVYKKMEAGQEKKWKPVLTLPNRNVEDVTHSPGSIPVFGAGKIPWSFFQQGQDTGSAILDLEGQPLEGESRVRSSPGSSRGTEGAASIREMALQELNPSAVKHPDFGDRREDPLEQAFLYPADDGTIPNKNGISGLLGHATMLANLARYREATEVLAKVIEADNLSMEAYYLLGVLCCRNGDLKEAEAHFRKVIYVTPDSALAYFHLGNIYLSERRFNEAAREFRNAIRLSAGRPKEEQLRVGEDVTVECLLKACRNNLAEISKRGG